jgi:tetratricopeptide (TPR) repeat protein
MEDIKYALKLEPTQYYLFDTKGEIHMKMEKYLEAIEDFTEALKLNDKCKDSYQKRAKCYIKLAEQEKNERFKADYLAKAKADEDEAAILPEQKVHINLVQNS